MGLLKLVIVDDEDKIVEGIANLFPAGGSGEDV